MSAVELTIACVASVVSAVTVYVLGHRRGDEAGYARGFEDGYAAGFSDGEHRGIAKGWQDRHFEQIAADKARRDREGRFACEKRRGAS